MKRSLSGHQSAQMKNDEWLTPPNLFNHLGVFDLDPCAPAVRPWATAKDHISKQADGLKTDWWGRVWCNPPFGSQWQKWFEKLADHGNGIGLIPARTETEAFFRLVWGRADGICFLKGRPHFHYVTGKRGRLNSGAPICLVAYGLTNGQVLKQSGLGFYTNISR